MDQDRDNKNVRNSAGEYLAVTKTVKEALNRNTVRPTRLMAVSSRNKPILVTEGFTMVTSPSKNVPDTPHSTFYAISRDVKSRPKGGAFQKPNTPSVAQLHVLHAAGIEEIVPSQLLLHPPLSELNTHPSQTLVSSNASSTPNTFWTTDCLKCSSRYIPITVTNGTQEGKFGQTGTGALATSYSTG